ncbi:MAG: hypothetical protein LBJ67_18840 [Planctomycetaceae bacterium]|jgi:hypothetical protein|nr:hypothetical protein [Planctomycetaceae bacterium]
MKKTIFTTLLIISFASVLFLTTIAGCGKIDNGSFGYEKTEQKNNLSDYMFNTNYIGMSYSINQDIEPLGMTLNVEHGVLSPRIDSGHVQANIIQLIYAHVTGDIHWLLVFVFGIIVFILSLPVFLLELLYILLSILLPSIVAWILALFIMLGIVGGVTKSCAPIGVIYVIVFVICSFTGTTMVLETYFDFAELLIQISILIRLFIDSYTVTQILLICFLSFISLIIIGATSSK